MFIIAKFGLALFTLTLGVICVVLYCLSPNDCTHYIVCFILLAIFHFLDSLGYCHEGYKAANDGYSLFSNEQDPDYKLKHMSQRDIIYINKTKEDGVKELKQMTRTAYITYNYLVLLYGIAAFIYVQVILFDYADTCRGTAPVLYVWLIVEVIIFYVALFLFATFGAYYAYKYKDQIQNKFNKFRNIAADRRKRFEYL